MQEVCSDTQEDQSSMLGRWLHVLNHIHCFLFFLIAFSNSRHFFLRRNLFFFFFVPSNYTNSHYFSISLPVDVHVFQSFSNNSFYPFSYFYFISCFFFAFIPFSFRRFESLLKSFVFLDVLSFSSSSTSCFSCVSLSSQVYCFTHFFFLTYSFALYFFLLFFFHYCYRLLFLFFFFLIPFLFVISYVSLYIVILFLLFIPFLLLITFRPPHAF